ncbi:MAG: hypothetical protein ACYSQZ_07850 [Planctomycetota bacterium]|jgi:hypothetical protein
MRILAKKKINTRLTYWMLKWSSMDICTMGNCEECDHRQRESGYTGLVGWVKGCAGG